MDRIRSEQAVKNTVHNLVQTLSVKLDSAARYGLYQDDTTKGGMGECADLFKRLEAQEAERIGELRDHLRERLNETA